MAAVAIAKSARLSLQLNAGTNPDTGKAIMKTVSIGGMASNADATKISDVVDLVAPCLAHPVAVTLYTVTKTIEKE